MSTETHQIPNIRTYRLRVLRAAGICGSVIAVLSIAAAFSISDSPMMAVSFFAGAVAQLMFSVCSWKLRLAK
jgi:hypothetical protein